MNSDSASTVNSKRFVIIFVIILITLLVAFTLMVRWATAILPQENEVISLVEAAQYIEQNEIERILIQEGRDIFLYQPGESRPLYLQLNEGQTFTETMETMGVTPDRFPLLTVEED